MTKRIEQLLSFYKNNPQEPFVLFALAKEYDKMEEYEKSLEFYQNLTDNHASYTGTYYHYGSFLLKNEKVEEARQVMQKGLEICLAEKDDHAHRELKGLFVENFDEE